MTDKLTLKRMELHGLSRPTLEMIRISFIRDNGEPTYFMTDIAYHNNKIKEGMTYVNIFGADHHGYVSGYLVLLML